MRQAASQLRAEGALHRYIAPINRVWKDAAVTWLLPCHAGAARCNILLPGALREDASVTPCLQQMLKARAAHLTPEGSKATRYSPLP